MAAPTDLDFLLRVLLATGCGALIDLERKPGGELSWASGSSRSRLATDILTTSHTATPSPPSSEQSARRPAIEVNGAFNAIRDLVYNKAGADDPKANDKIDDALKVVEENKRMTVPFNKLRLAAPNNVLEAATQVNATILVLLRATTEPFAQPIARKEAGAAIDDFIDVFWKEVGNDLEENNIRFNASLHRRWANHRRADPVVPDLCRRQFHRSGDRHALLADR